MARAITADLINGLFETGGACAVGLSVWRIQKDRYFAGVHPASTVFFQSWGLWNLFFYPAINQPFSFIGGIALAAANSAYLFQLWRFSNAKPTN